jgi:hypothetical protein
MLPPWLGCETSALIQPQIVKDLNCPKWDMRLILASDLYPRL